ncbi:MAG: substrate-binding domain-containing protein [Chloroflexota bacterium]
MAKVSSRLDQIVRLVNEQRYLSVADLSRLLGVSEMTMRRDLAQLHDEKRIQRTYGGAATRQENGASLSPENGAGYDAEDPAGKKPGSLFVDQMDVMIATSVNPYYDKLLLDRVGKKGIPIIAESLAMPNQRTVVAVDNYQAGLDLGRATGEYLAQHGYKRARLLDLTFTLINTSQRSQGFIDGLGQTFPGREVVLSINAQSRAATAYRITYDALAVHPEINVIFAINDATAQGAMRACAEIGLDASKITLVTFGLEGDTLRSALMGNSYIKLGLAMFPEIVSLACIDAAIRACQGEDSPEQYITPHVVLTAQTLPEYYTRTPDGWRLNWEVVRARLPLPPQLQDRPCFNGSEMCYRIGFIVPFSSHEWYQELTRNLKEFAAQCGARLHIIDAEQNVQDEVELRRRAIARQSAGLIEAGDVILVDGGPIAGYLAEELRGRRDLTVITNSVDVINALNPSPGITLISTGGALRYSSQMLVGPTAESALKELRADKLFLTANGISLDFGLSHTNISEVTMKQAMIRSARQVILTADHTAFTSESVIQVSPLSVVSVLITDDALPPDIRLNLAKLGIRLILA